MVRERLICPTFKESAKYLAELLTAMSMPPRLSISLFRSWDLLKIEPGVTEVLKGSKVRY
jgi:hypothetical protein